MADARAKTKRLQKRRKVWVNEYVGGALGPIAHGSKHGARKRLRAAQALGAMVPFVEARPGDVVLSREDVDALAFALADDLRALLDAHAEALDALEGALHVLRESDAADVWEEETDAVKAVLAKAGRR